MTGKARVSGVRGSACSSGMNRHCLPPCAKRSQIGLKSQSSHECVPSCDESTPTNSNALKGGGWHAHVFVGMPADPGHAHEDVGVPPRSCAKRSQIGLKSQPNHECVTIYIESTRLNSNALMKTCRGIRRGAALSRSSQGRNCDGWSAYPVFSYLGDLDDLAVGPAYLGRGGWSHRLASPSNVEGSHTSGWRSSASSPGCAAL